ncbi:MAG: 1-acyl-sn-glycerol-3-phosphate acyltransferase [Pseudomonadales bacterium]
MPVRRLITIPLFVASALVMTLALPVLIVTGTALSLFAPLRGTLRTLLFLTGYLWCEAIGILVSAIIWLRYRDQTAFLNANYQLQGWWANALKRLAEILFNLRFEITGEQALAGKAAFMLPRHASIADTIIPMVFYAIPYRLRLRYVLKQELLIDPCLDIVGNRLPNLFVDRSGQDSESARRGVATLTQDLAEDEGVLIYPEGTRFSQSKRDALRVRQRDNHALLAQLARWRLLMPPRLGGTLALLENNPGRDLVFCAHTGFEGSSHFSSLLNGSWVGAQVRIHFWRVPFATIPQHRDAQVHFLFEQWDLMETEVKRLRETSAAA